MERPSMGNHGDDEEEEEEDDPMPPGSPLAPSVVWWWLRRCCGEDEGKTMRAFSAAASYCSLSPCSPMDSE